MTYIEGFVVAVPAANKESYRQHAAAAAPLVKEFGVLRHVEAWGDDVPDGKVTDFRRAVQAKEDEAVVFSWFEYPDRKTRDAANQKFMTDPRMEAMGADMPFDGKRMIVGGFGAFLEHGEQSRAGYMDGFIVPVPKTNREAYRAEAEKMAAAIMKLGASRVVETWGDDLPNGKVTDFRRAVQATGDENVVFSWTEWPSKEVRDAGWKKMMEDPAMQPGQSPMPFDGKRLIYAGFVTILDA